MLNIGIVGNTEVLEPYVKRIQKNKNVNVIGKASVGTNAQLNSFHFSIPEFNRVELVERADVLLIDNSSRLPFDMLCNMVKKSKHIFTTEYLDFSVDECQELAKLSHESGSVVQVSNPYFFTSEVQWLNTNLSSPFFLDVSKYSNNPDRNKTLYPLLLMLIKLTGINPKKVGVVAFESVERETNFLNVRLEFGSASVVNISFGNQIPLDKFKIEGYSKKQFVSLELDAKNYSINNELLDLSDYSIVNEFDSFIDAIESKSQKNSGIEDYLATIILGQTINKRVLQYIT
jgi:hypothetical protein